MHIYAIFFVAVLYIVEPSGAELWLDSDTGLNLYEFITNHNYYYENYTVTTDDGYILHTVRIPYPKGENASTASDNTTKPAVLLLHGIWSNPEDLILSGDISIGFLLVEHGFEVYLMASRGNTYSTSHVSLSTDSKEYWNFSWHEVGYYDIPANIDLITNLTGNQNVSFVGHSQGSTAFLVLAATRPEYSERISVAHLLSPVVYMDNTRLPISFLVENLDQVENLVSDLGLDSQGLFTYSPIIELLGVLFCARDAPTVELCVDLLGIVGPDPDQLNRSLITVMASNDPAGGSYKQVFHYLQIADSSEFKQYDYGSSGNLEAYNQTTPPFYNLTATTVPIYIWYGANDYFSGVADFQRLITEVGSAVGKEVTDLLWNHIDFAFAIDAKDYVYDAVISSIQELTDGL